VGENFQDHPLSALVYELAAGETSLDILQDPKEIQKAMAEYGATKSGPLASSGSGNCFASYATLSTREEVAAIQQSVLSPSRRSEATKGLLAEALVSPDDASIHITYIAAPLDMGAFPSQEGMAKSPVIMQGKQGISFTIAAQRPVSVGSCHIISNNPQDNPAIDPAYLSHLADLEVMAGVSNLLRR
jgi:choline dehydrogenase-like flavoprotein